MKIGINVSWMTPGQAGGMEGYVRNLIDQLGIIDCENEYVLVAAPNNYKTFRLPSSRWKMVIYAGRENSPLTYKVSSGVITLSSQRFSLLRGLYRQLKTLSTPGWTGKLRELIAREGIELWFCPLIYALPIDTDIPVVTTIPDVQHEHYPEFFNEDQLALRTLGYQYSCKISTAVIGISNYVANEIVKLYGINPAKVFATPLALDQSFQMSRPEIERLVARARLKYRLDYDFVFYPANGWRHKNHENLIKAMEIVRSRGGQIKLILTGAEFDIMDRLRPLLSQSELRQAVRHLGYVDKKDLIGLYSAAKMLIFPSYFEGFGLPLLEAMYLGTPIACSGVGSLSEVGGNAVLYFDPHNPEDIAEAILKIVESEDVRQQLIIAGKKQLQCFDFAETARRTLAIFEQIQRGILARPNLPPFVPLMPHKWLMKGHSRWYFRCVSLHKIEFKVIQPTSLKDLSDQKIEAFLNGQKVLEAQIAPQREYQFAIPGSDNAKDGFHRLDISALVRAKAGRNILSVQVPSIIIADNTGRRLSLIK